MKTLQARAVSPERFLEIAKTVNRNVVKKIKIVKIGELVHGGKECDDKWLNIQIGTSVYQVYGQFCDGPLLDAVTVLRDMDIEIEVEY
jgi:hypothetical protein